MSFPDKSDGSNNSDGSDKTDIAKANPMARVV